MSKEERIENDERALRNQRYWAEYYAKCGNWVAVTACRRAIAEIEADIAELRNR